MKQKVQRWWPVFLIPVLSVFLTHADLLAQNSMADLISADSPLNRLSDGGFESAVPTFWESSGDGAEWSNEMAHTPEYSLKLSGSGEASWTMPEGVQKWVSAHPADGTLNPEVLVGAWVYTEGVNTSPASDDEKFQLVFGFYKDATQTENVLGEDVVIDLPQDAASTDGWVEVSNEALGAITFPEPQAAKSTKVTIRKGANATGTVYVDDLFMRVAEGSEGWAGGFFNPNMDVVAGYYYWFPDFDQGLASWPEEQKFFMTATTADAYEGDYSLRIESNGENQDEAVGISERVPVDGPMLVAFRVKHEGAAKDTIAVGEGQNVLGVRIIGYSNLEGGAAGYGQTDELQIPFTGMWNGLPSGMLVPLLVDDGAGKTGGADWTQYAFVWYPTAASSYMEIRLSYWHQFSGVTYWDDVFIAPVGAVTVGTAIEEDIVDRSIPERYILHQNYPNPFNPTTTIAFDLKEQSEVTLSVYNVMGQKVASLLSNQILASGTQRVQFNANELPSGTYLYVLEVDGTTVAHKMVLLK